MPNWTTQYNTTQTRAAIKNYLLNDRKTQMALALRMTKLARQLHNEIKRTPNMNEERAFEILQKELRKFGGNIEKQVDIIFNKQFAAPLDQTNLSNPINMTMALSNPDSYVSQQINATIGAITDSLNIETAEVEETIKQEEQDQTTQMMQKNTTDEKEEDTIKDLKNTTDEKKEDGTTKGLKNITDEKKDDAIEDFATLGAVGRAASDAIKAFDTGNTSEETTAINKIYEKATGHAGNIKEFMKKEEEVTSPFMSTLTPKSLLKDEKEK